jgi:hypothetical protein
MAQKKSIESVKKEILILQEQLKKLQEKEITRLGLIAAKAGLLDMPINDDDLLKEFSRITDSFQKKSQIDGQKSLESKPNSSDQKAA